MIRLRLLAGFLAILALPLFISYAFIDNVWLWRSGWALLLLAIAGYLWDLRGRI